MEFLYYALKVVWFFIVLLMANIVFNYFEIRSKSFRLRQKQIETNKELAKQIEELKRIIDGL